MPHLLLPQGGGTRGLQDLKERGSRGDLGSGLQAGELPAQLPQQTPREEKGATRPRAVRTQGEGRRCRGTHGGGGAGGGAHGPGRWLVAEKSAVGAFSKAGQVPLSGCQGCHLRPASLEMGKQCRFQAGQQASRPAEPSFGGGLQTFLFQSQDSGTKEPKESNTFQDLIS